MHRAITLPGQVPSAALDMLSASKNAYVALSKFMETVIGTATALSGLTCIPGIPAGMNVVVNPGAIFSSGAIDSTAYGALAADTSANIVKQGLLETATVFALTAPVTVGHSIDYLIQFQFQTTDAVPVVRQYFDASNPTVPWSGPANSGAADQTVRQDNCAVQLKAGVSAVTGLQVTPTPDAGWTGGWVITVAAGQTTITTTDIAEYPGAPFLRLNLGSASIATQTDVQSDDYKYSVDTGAASAFAIAPSPAISAPVDGMRLYWRATNPSTGASTVSINAIPAATLLLADGSAVGNGDIQAGNQIEMVYSSAAGAWLIASGANAYATAAQFDDSGKVANTAFVRRRGHEYAGVEPYAAAATLTVADAGKLLVLSGATYTLTLPAANSFPAGGTLNFESGATGAVTIQRAGADTIKTGSPAGATSLVLKDGDALELVSDGASLWYIQGGSLADDATQFDDTARAATTSWVHDRGVQYAASKSIAAALTMDATYAGALTTLGGTTYTVTLPLANTYADGARLSFLSRATGAVTLAAQGTDLILRTSAAGAGSIVLSDGDTLDLVSDGAGNWRVDAISTATLIATTAPQFDNDTSVATTAFVKRFGLEYAGVQSYAAAATLTVADAGKLIIASGATYTLTLPAANAFPAGATLNFECVGTGVVTVARAGADTVQVNDTTTTSLNLQKGDTLKLVSDGAAKWYAAGGSAQMKYAASFDSSLVANGYQKLPSGLIMQWGTVTTDGTGRASGAFPIAFPTIVLNFQCNIRVANASGLIYGSSGIAATLGTWELQSYSAIALAGMNFSPGQSVHWLAFGK